MTEIQELKNRIEKLEGDMQCALKDLHFWRMAYHTQAISVKPHDKYGRRIKSTLYTSLPSTSATSGLL